jgi:FkbM family methyltransferase
MHDFYVFPFNQVPKGSEIVLYGAGVVGYDYYLQVTALGYCRVLAVVDPYYKTVDQFKPLGVPVHSPEQIPPCDFIVIATRFAEYAEAWRAGLDVPPEKIIGQCRSLESGVQGLPFVRPMYAQRGEDWMVYSLFQFLGMPKPSYLDVGAHHPYELSNTALLYQQGGRGINIEPNPDLFENFKTARPQDINLCAGVGSQPGTLPFYMLADDFGAAAPALNSFSKQAVEEMIATGKSGRKLHVEKTMEIPVILLRDALAHHNGTWPDYMSMDIEGGEYAVLEGADLAQGPILITVEVDKQDAREFCALMEGKGYVFYCRSGGNITYIREDYRERAIYG